MKGDSSQAEAVEAVALSLGPKARRDWPLGRLTTYRVGGPAALFVELDSLADLEEVHAALRGWELELLVLGKGSNLLVADSGFPGLVVWPGAGFSDIVVAGTAVEAGASATYPVLARRTVAAGLTGMEWAVGVPGSVGGAVRMNAGGHGSETREVLKSCEAFDLRTGGAEKLTADALAYGYRRSSIAPHQVVLSGRFELERGDRDASEVTLTEVVRWRRLNQPGGQNAGSIFTNPPDNSAGRLIEQAGLKGFRVGSASVSAKHANFFQADPDGSADDVGTLIQEVRSLVEARTGVRLDTEVQLAGSFPNPLVDREHQGKDHLERRGRPVR